MHRFCGEITYSSTTVPPINPLLLNVGFHISAAGIRRSGGLVLQGDGDLLVLSELRSTPYSDRTGGRGGRRCCCRRRCRRRWRRRHFGGSRSRSIWKKFHCFFELFSSWKNFNDLFFWIIHNLPFRLRRTAILASASFAARVADLNLHHSHPDSPESPMTRTARTPVRPAVVRFNSWNI